MAYRLIALAFAATTALAGAAQAQDAAIATAPAAAGAASGAPISASQAATNRQIDEYLNQADAEPLPIESPPVKRQIHGEVGASIGSNGYRSAYASTVIPIGETGELGVAYGEARSNGRKGWGGGTSKSLSVSLVLDKPLFSSSSGGKDCIVHTGVPLPSDAAARAKCRGAAQPETDPAPE